MLDKLLGKNKGSNSIGMAKSMLKMFGIDLDNLIPQLLPMLKAKILEGIQHLETEAESPLMFVAQLVPGTDNISVCLYKVTSEGNQLYKQYNSSEGEDFLQKMLLAHGTNISASGETDTSANANNTDITYPGEQ